ncbi:MAG TPA: DUF2269 family protein [Ktedonobacteraceae bacterium]|nr:DUF2269 family protein [Ktedonobacteraceae bacterium]
MSFYTVALFAHMLGVLGLFTGIGLQWTSFLRFRRAQFVAQVREWASLTSVLGVLMPAASLLILVAGSYMTLTTWGWRTPWIDVSLAALILVLAPMGAMNTHRLKAIQTAAEASAHTKTIPAELQRQITDPIVWTLVQTSGLTLVGVVFLMIIKPDLVGSLITLAVALVLGVGSARIFARPRQGIASGKEVKQRHHAQDEAIATGGWYAHASRGMEPGPRGEARRDNLPGDAA